MALTLGAQTRNAAGGRYQTMTRITVDTSYPAGGWPLTGTQLGLPTGQVDSVAADQNGVTAAGGVTLAYDKANQKLMAFGGAAAGAAQAEITGGVNLTTQLANLQLVAYGR
jgi:hypothetical protein